MKKVILLLIMLLLMMAVFSEAAWNPVGKVPDSKAVEYILEGILLSSPRIP